MDIYVTAGTAHYGEIGCADWLAPCTLGAGGVRHYKSEGDYATPLGRFLLRALYYRPDRWPPPPPPQNRLPCYAITRHCGWSDDARDAAYNRYVRLPHRFGCEKLWREDALYDCFLVLGYNDAPALAGRGSAIFLHLQNNPRQPTRGCVAVDGATMRRLVRHAQLGDAVVIRG